MGNLSNILGGLWSPTEPDSPEIQLVRAMSAAGLEPNGIHMDGNIHRFSTDGSKDAGWYVAYGDKPQAAVFGSWKTGEQSSWVADVGHKLTAGEAIVQSRRIAELRIKRDRALKEKQHNAANTVQLIWDAAGEAVDSHAYLMRKGVKAHGLRITGDGRLIAPLFNDGGELTSLQYISIDGSKQYHAGGAVKGSFMTLGSPETECFIVEGYATGATVYETTGKPVIIAYSANNLVKVTEAFKDLSVTIVADNDESGVGQKAAQEAADICNGRVITPPEIGDANDYAQAGGDLRGLLLEEDTQQDQNIIDKLQIVFGDELPEDFEPPDELVEGLLCLENITMIYGDSNSGKTFFAIELASAIAIGEDFFDRKVDQGLVLYIASESPGSVRSRLQAIRKYHKTNLENIAIIQKPVNFHNNKESLKEVIAAAKLFERRKGKKINLIIGDTLARISAGANENAGVDMGVVMEQFDMLKNQTGAAVVIIHHTGKDAAKGSRGWSGMRAHIDTEIEITEKSSQNGTVRVAEITKQRDLGIKGEKICFDLQVVDMGSGKFGNKVTTCIVVPTDKEPKAKTSSKVLEEINQVCSAWESSKKEHKAIDLIDYPFISSNDWATYIQAYAGITLPAAKQRLKLSSKGKNTAIRLSEAKIITVELDGFLIIGETGKRLLLDQDKVNLVDKKK